METRKDKNKNKIVSILARAKMIPTAIVDDDHPVHETKPNRLQRMVHTRAPEKKKTAPIAVTATSTDNTHATSNGHATEHAADHVPDHGEGHGEGHGAGHDAHAKQDWSEIDTVAWERI